MKIQCSFKEDKNHWSWKYNLYFRLNVTELVLSRLQSDACWHLWSLCHWISHKENATCEEIASKWWKAEDVMFIPKCVAVALEYFSTGTVDVRGGPVTVWSQDCARTATLMGIRNLEVVPLEEYKWISAPGAWWDTGVLTLQGGEMLNQIIK